jgi:hypothetical protein
MIAGVAVAMLSLAPPVPRAQADGELDGAIDFHAYGAPDFFARNLSDVEVAQLSGRYGMRGLVLMNHVTSTADRAALASMLVPGVEVFGGVVLNHAVGGLNPAAVTASALMQGGRGKLVWLPTIDAEHHLRVLSMSGEGIVVAHGDRVTPEMEAVLKVVAQQDLVLQTGHVSPHEALVVIRRARELGIERIVVTSPMSLPGFSLDQMIRAARMGAYLELDYVNALMGPQAHLEWMRPWPRVTIEQMAAAIRTIGAEHFVLGTELGQIGNPVPPDGYLLFVQGLEGAGITRAEIELMMKTNPARVLGLEPASRSARLNSQTG